MDIFISWSGKRSRAFAEALRDWLPMIINAARPFLSSSDIDKGARWSTEIAARLEKAKAGIICLTPSNMQSEWILFEAGALSKTLADTYVCTLLIDMKPTDVKGPLSQFQATTASKEDMLQLVKTLYSKLGESGVQVAQLEKAFKLMWPELSAQIQTLPEEVGAKAPGRSAEDMLDELLGLVRNLNRSTLSIHPGFHSFPLGSALDEIRYAIAEIFKQKFGTSLHTIVWDNSGLQGNVVLINKVGHKRRYRFIFPPWASRAEIEEWARLTLPDRGEDQPPEFPQ